MFETLGGRKFVGLLILVIAGVVVELYSPKGLGAEMAGLLAALYATFSAANAVVSRKYADTEVATKNTEAQLEVVRGNQQAPAVANLSPEAINAIVSGFEKLGEGQVQIRQDSLKLMEVIVALQKRLAVLVSKD